MAETEKERGKPPLPTLEEAMAWEGMQIDGLGNKSLGRIAGIHVDAEDGEPRWALIRLGPAASGPPTSATGSGRPRAFARTSR
jgi:hypothetical protein